MAVTTENNEILKAVIQCFGPWYDMGLFQRNRLTIAGTSVATLEKKVTLDLKRY
jgi:hypothetical protein